MGGDEHSSPGVDVDPWLESLPSTVPLWPAGDDVAAAGTRPVAAVASPSPWTATIAPPPSSPWDVPAIAPVGDVAGGEDAGARRPWHHRRMVAAGAIVLAGMGLGWVLSPGGGSGLVGKRGAAMALGAAGEVAEHVAQSHAGATTVPVVTAPPLVPGTEAVASTVPTTVPVSAAAPSVITPIVLPATGRHRGHHRASSQTLSASTGAALAQVPPDVAQIASDLIAQIDTQGAGRVHVPDSATNIVLLARWMANEGGLWANNPLNTDLHAGQYPHQFSSSGQDTGTPIYPSMHVGVVNAAATLLGNSAYAPILKSLESRFASCLSFATAVIHSPWAASHYEYDTSRFCSATPSQAVVPRNRPGRGRHGRRR